MPQAQRQDTGDTGPGYAIRTLQESDEIRERPPAAGSTSTVPAPLTLEEVYANADDFPDFDEAQLALGVLALRPREYLGDLPVIERFVDPANCSARRGDWPGDAYLATDADGQLVEVVAIRDDLEARAAENGMGC